MIVFFHHILVKVVVPDDILRRHNPKFGLLNEPMNLCANRLLFAFFIRLRKVNFTMEDFFIASLSNLRKAKLTELELI